MALFVQRIAPPPATVTRPVGLTLLETPLGRQLVEQHVGALIAESRAAGADPKPAEPAAASTDTKENSSPEWEATLASVLAFVIGLVIAVTLFGTDSGPTYAAAQGVGAFALFYVAAQAAERLVEICLPAFEKIPWFGTAAEKIERDKKVANALNAADQSKKVAAADAQARVDQLRANRTAVVFGLTAGLGMVLCGYLEADFLTTLGVNFGADPGTLEQALMLAVTGLIVGGGAKALHDTISNLSKSSEKKSTPAETGGSA